MLANLDPLGMPIATKVVSGETADDGLYIPIFDQVRLCRHWDCYGWAIVK